MGSRRVKSILGLGLVSIGGVVTSTAHSQDIFLPHRQRVCDLGCIPGSGYRTNRILASESLFATASVDQPVSITQYRVEGRARKSESVLRKQFFSERLTVSAADATLDNLALAIYSTGEIQCQGRLELTGTASHARVRVRIRAVASGHQGDGNVSGGIEIWSTAQVIPVRRSEGLTVPLIVKTELPLPIAPYCESHQHSHPPISPKLATIRGFDEITHLEIRLERLTQQ